MLLGSSLWQMSFGESAYEPLIYIFCMMAGVLVMLPLLVYLFTLWTSRRDNLLSVLKADSLKIYYEQFYPQIAIQADVCKQFKAHFNRLYGRRNYIFPIILLGILTALAVYAGIETLLVWNHMAAPTACMAAATTAQKSNAPAYKMNVDRRQVLASAELA